MNKEIPYEIMEMGPYSESMTKQRPGQVFSCWSNVSRRGFDQHVSQFKAMHCQKIVN